MRVVVVILFDSLQFKIFLKFSHLLQFEAPANGH
jgi:hypothetical protein